MPLPSAPTNQTAQDKQVDLSLLEPALRKRKTEYHDFETFGDKKRHRRDSKSSSNSQESDTTDYEEDNSFDENIQENFINLPEFSEKTQPGLSTWPVARSGTGENGSSCSLAPSTCESPFPENLSVDESGIMLADEFASSE